MNNKHFYQSSNFQSFYDNLLLNNYMDNYELDEELPCSYSTVDTSECPTPKSSEKTISDEASAISTTESALVLAYENHINSTDELAIRTADANQLNSTGTEILETQSASNSEGNKESVKESSPESSNLDINSQFYSD